MDLSAEQIASKRMIGHLGGAPVFEIETTGGLSMVVVLRNGRVEPLGSGPHRAVSRHIARKKEPSLQLHELAKNEDAAFDPNGRVVSRYEQLTSLLRRAGGFSG
jgi:hypothetical protein